MILHNRRNIRLQGYDYSSEGLYFVTICVQNRLCLFGKIVEDEMILNDAGRIVNDTWHDLPNHNPNIELDAWCIMPNHVHGIIIIKNIEYVGVDSKSTQNNDWTDLESVPTRKHHGLPEIIRQFKSFSTRRINKLQYTAGSIVWQRNYYEHIIRNNNSYLKIVDYINNNPCNWETDKYYLN